MRLAKSVKLAFNILAHSRLRSWLSVVGIVIGVASVITILSLGEGMQQSLEENLGGLGSDIITISPGFSKASGAGGSFHGGEDRGGGISMSTTTKNLTQKDVQSLKLISNIKYIQGIVSGRADVNYLTETASFSVKGVDTKVWKDIEITELDSGRYLSQGDTNVVVIGHRVAQDKFKTDIQLNRQITIEDKPFRVVGILKESKGMGTNSDSTIFMPIDIARITLEDIGEKEFNSIEIRIKDVNLIDETLNQTEERLKLSRAVNERTKDFSVNSVKAMQETISSAISSMTLFLGAIAAISLLVGAVGIANTMFTTVLEKTKEIGVMKSIGAKNKDILLIFLFNSAMIGLAGGILGSILGIFLSKGILIMINSMGIDSPITSTIITTQSLLVVFGFSVSIGILSGIIPAYRASKMNPVDALRYE